MADSQAPQRFRRAPFKHGNSPIEKGAVSGPFFIRINIKKLILILYRPLTLLFQAPRVGQIEPTWSN